MDAFGYTTNSKGYKVLPDFIRTVQGDGVRRETLPKVFMEMERRGLATDNAVFGMGGGLLQHCNRDTMEFGMKANAAKVNGEWRDIGKSPTGDTMKLSKKGRLALKYADGEYSTVKRDEIAAGGQSAGAGLPQRPAAEEVGLLRTEGATANARCPESYYADYVAPLRRGRPGRGTPVGA